MLDFEREAPDDRLTLDDLGSTTVTTIYDAYVSYADNDLAFVQSLCEFLESPQVGLKLFVRERDLLIGQMEFHAFTELMEKRCKRLLIVLSPEFLNSAECEFQTRFTMSLQIQERQRRLVPIVYRACELPALIKFLSKIDLSRGDQIPQWTWRKLIFSLRTQSQDGHFFPAPSLVLPASVSSSSPSFPLTSSPTMNAAIGWPTTSTVASNLPSDPRTRPQSTPITDVDSMSNPQVVGSFDRVKATVITELEDNSSNCSTKDTNKITSQLLPNNKTAISTSSAEPFLSRLWKKINRRPMKR